MNTRNWLAAFGLFTSVVAAAHADQLSAQTPHESTAPSQDAALTSAEIDALQQLHAHQQVEREAGQLANKRARNVTIKRYGQLLLTRTTASARELSELAQKLGLRLEAPSNHELEELRRTVSPANFDRAFLNVVGHDQTRTLRILELAQAAPQTPAVQSLIDKTLPVLREDEMRTLQQLHTSPF
jgi:predicted outer membrane protein